MPPEEESLIKSAIKFAEKKHLQYQERLKANVELERQRLERVHVLQQEAIKIQYEKQMKINEQKKFFEHYVDDIKDAKYFKHNAFELMLLKRSVEKKADEEDRAKECEEIKQLFKRSNQASDLDYLCMFAQNESHKRKVPKEFDNSNKVSNKKLTVKDSKAAVSKQSTTYKNKRMSLRNNRKNEVSTNMGKVDLLQRLRVSSINKTSSDVTLKVTRENNRHKTSDNNDDDAIKQYFKLNQEKSNKYLGNEELHNVVVISDHENDDEINVTKAFRINNKLNDITNDKENNEKSSPLFKSFGQTHLHKKSKNDDPVCFKLKNCKKISLVDTFAKLGDDDEANDDEEEESSTCNTDKYDLSPHQLELQENGDLNISSVTLNGSNNSKDESSINHSMNTRVTHCDKVDSISKYIKIVSPTRLQSIQIDSNKSVSKSPAQQGDDLDYGCFSINVNTHSQDEDESDKEDHNSYRSSSISKICHGIKLHDQSTSKVSIGRGLLRYDEFYNAREKLASHAFSKENGPTETENAKNLELKNIDIFSKSILLMANDDLTLDTLKSPSLPVASKSPNLDIIDLTTEPLCIRPMSPSEQIKTVENMKKNHGSYLAKRGITLSSDKTFRLQSIIDDSSFPEPCCSISSLYNNNENEQSNSNNNLGSDCSNWRSVAPPSRKETGFDGGLNKSWSSTVEYGGNGYNQRPYKDIPLLKKKFKYGFIDTHCHLDFLFKKLQYDNTFQRYREDCQHSEPFPASFEGCIAVFCDPDTIPRRNWWSAFLEEDNIWGAFGCHPHFAHRYSSFEEFCFRDALKHDRVVALGEIGLDYSAKNNNSKELQQRVFEEQIKIALEYKKPIMIHCRDAHRDCIGILKKLVPRDYLIHRHCFTGDWEEADEWLETFPNSFLSFTCLITFSRLPRSSGLRDVAARIPLNRFLIETDSPYFRPWNYPSSSEHKFCHPGMAIHVAEEIAKLRNLPIDDILLHARQNTKTIYKI